MKKPRRVLGQAYSARNLLLITPMLAWLLHQGLRVKKLHWVRQFSPRRTFQPIVNMVTKFRTLADRDPSFALQGTSMKLAGNSIYGKMLESGAKHTNIKLTDENGLKKCIERATFRSAEPVTEELFEVESAKTQFTEDKALIIGFFILQYSKLRMLKFIYEFLDRFLDRNRWQSILMDTDSLYVALAGKNLDDMISAEHREAYEKAKSQFVVCSKEQKREPGLMKLEWCGDGVIALCPKSYYCFNKKDPSQDKKSHKGVQKHNNLTKHDYFTVLQSQSRRMITNKGIWFKKGRFVKYRQQKSGLPYLITKMRTENDGITLTPLPEPSDGVDAIIDHSDSE